MAYGRRHLGSFNFDQLRLALTDWMMTAAHFVLQLEANDRLSVMVLVVVDILKERTAAAHERILATHLRTRFQGWRVSG